MNANERKILEDAAKILADLGVTVASGGTASAVLLADVPTAKDALERILLELPAIDAPALDPLDRAEVDAEVKAEGEQKFPPKPE